MKRVWWAPVLLVAALLVPAGPALASASYGPDPLQVFDAYVPSSARNGAAVILIHGGGWSGGNKGSMHPYAAELAAHGFVAFNMEYRKDSPAMWRDEPQDVRLMIDYVKSHAGGYGVSPARIGLFGFSAGGHLALLGATTGSGSSGAPGRVKAVAAWAGPSNLVQIVTEEGCPVSPCGGLRTAGDAVQAFEGHCTLAGCFDPAGGFAQAPVNGCGSPCLTRYLATSPVRQAGLGDPATFLAQFPGDLVVPFEQTVEMAAALSAYVVSVEVHPVAQSPSSVGHGLWPTSSTVWQQTLSFFGKKL